MDAYLGEIRLFAGTYAPEGWLFCNGQILAISQYQALYAVVGTTYGGDGRNTFALPDLRGRVPMGAVTERVLGQAPGSSMVTLSSGEMPGHTHSVNGKMRSPASSMNTDPSGNVWAVNSALRTYTSACPDTTLDPRAVGAFQGGGGAHNNVQPCVGINYIISIDGYFPPFE